MELEENKRGDGCLENLRMHKQQCVWVKHQIPAEVMSDLINRLVDDVVDKDNQDDFKNRLKKQLKAKWLKE